jgi:O-antigen ligase
MPAVTDQRYGGTILSFGLAGLVFLSHLALGANRATFALIEASTWFAVLAVLLALPLGRRAFGPMSFGYLSVAFGFVIALGVLSLTPYGVGGPDPVWGFVPAKGIVSVDPYATVIELIKLLGLAATFLVGCIVGDDNERGTRLIRAILRVGIIYCAWAFLDHFTSPELLFGEPRPFGAYRLSASFLSGNTAATLFGVLAILNLTDLVRQYERTRSSRGFSVREIERFLPRLVLPLVGMALSATCLILTMSRSGITATAAMAIILLGAIAIAQSRRGALSVPLVATSAILGGLLIASAAMNLDALHARVSLLDSDAVLRSRIFAAHFAAFQDGPWMGYGLGSFGHINAMIMDPKNVSALDRLGAAHDVFIQWLEEGGILGAGAMFATIGLVALQIVGGVRVQTRSRTWLLAMLAVLGLFVIHGATDYALEVPSMATFLSLLLGLAFAMSRPRLSTRNRRAETPFVAARGASRPKASYRG